MCLAVRLPVEGRARAGTGAQLLHVSVQLSVLLLACLSTFSFGVVCSQSDAEAVSKLSVLADEQLSAWELDAKGGTRPDGDWAAQG